jgi:hypothetical protein
MKREPRFLEKVKRIMPPFFARNLGQVEKNVPILRGMIEGDGEAVPLGNDGSV